MQERRPQPVSPPVPMQTATVEEVAALDMLAGSGMSAAQPDMQPHGSTRPRVTFMDDVQGGGEEVCDTSCVVAACCRILARSRCLLLLGLHADSGTR